MQRRTAFLMAGLLTAVVVTSLILFTGLSLANSAEVVEPANTTANETSVEAAFAVRERALQERIAEGEGAIEALEDTFQPQLDDLSAVIQIVEGDMVKKNTDVTTLQESATQLEAAIQQDGLSFQEQLVTLQERDTQLRIQLDATLAELQSAYDQLAARQSTVAAGDGSNDGAVVSNENGGAEQHENEDHHDDDHHEEEDHDDD